jgi:hypothetical protein
VTDTEHQSGDLYEVEVELLLAGSTKVRADSAEEALEIVEGLPDAEIRVNDMSPHGEIETKGVYRLDD